MAQKTRMDVEVLTVTDPDTGQICLVRDGKYFDRQQQAALTDMERRLVRDAAQFEEPEKADKYASSVRERTTAMIKAQMSAERTRHEKAADGAERQHFTLTHPTYGEVSRARSLATQTGEDGSTQWDENLFLRELLKDNVEGLKANEVLELNPVIAGELGDRLRRAVTPSDNLLPFM